MPADYLSDDIDTEAAYALYNDSVPRYEPTDGLTEDMLAIIRMYADEFKAYADDYKEAE
jgi:hypothetical protein